MRKAIYTSGLLIASVTTWAQVNILTNRYDNARTGANLNESVLNTSNVNPTQFGKLYTYPVSGAVFAQPLYMAGLNIPGKGVHNVVFVATMNDVIYAFDADSSSSTPLWSRDFTNAPSVTPVPIADITGNNNLNIINNVGILSTPVIDSSTNTLYCVARTKESGNYVQRLHAIDVTTGAEKFGGPVTIAASVPGNGLDAVGGKVTFNPKMQNQRASLGLANGVVLIAWGSHEDIEPWHGWVMGYSASTLAQVGVFCTTPNTSKGGIWQGGRGPVIDSTGAAYYQTGNAVWNGSTEFGDTLLKLNVSTSGISLADWFTPSDNAYLDSSDSDLASTGALIMPGTTTLVGGGKESVLYLVNSKSMGHETSTDSQIIQLLRVNGGEMKGGPAYWKSASLGPLVFDWPQNDRLRSWHYNGSTLDTGPVAQSAAVSPGSPGGVLAISANGNTDGTGIVWAEMSTSVDDDHGLAAGIVRALNATTLQEIWNSESNASRDRLGTLVKFAAPLVANGKVYAVTYDNAIAVYGLLAPADFTVSANPASASAAAGSKASYTITIGSLNGFAGSVNLSVGTLPSGVTASISPSSLTGGGSATLTAAGTSAGTYTIPVTATSGSIAHSTSVTLVVTASSGYPNGYAHRRTITVKHTNVPNTDQSSFPVFFNSTDPLFKSTSNGGHVTSASGYDMIFSTDPNGASKLNHTVISYGASTGTFKAWVNLPTLSHSTDTVFYLFYGNSSVTTSQQTSTGVFDGNYVGIYHLNTPSGTVGSGATSAGGAQVGLGVAFDGTANAYIDLGTATKFDLPGAFTISTWFKKTAYTGNYEILASKCAAAACNYELALDKYSHSLEAVQDGNTYATSVVPSLNQWHYAVESSDGTHLYFYLDGVLAQTLAHGTGATLPGTNFNLGREEIAGQNFLGILDEARLSRIARSADWIATEYINQLNPSSFYSISAEQ